MAEKKTKETQEPKQVNQKMVDGLMDILHYAQEYREVVEEIVNNVQNGATPAEKSKAIYWCTGVLDEHYKKGNTDKATGDGCPPSAGDKLRREVTDCLKRVVGGLPQGEPT